MSRSSHERASSKRSKMDRYTEDLKYSLRRRLSESVGKGTLRTDDILARSHRQIVSDFTDPRQWYYSATHDYIIALMRESQKQNDGSVWDRSGSRRMERGSSRGHSPSTTKDGRQGRHKGSFIEIPTTTSEDLQEIRGLAGKTPDIIIQDKHVQSDIKGLEVEGSPSLSQTQISKDTKTDNSEDGKIALLDCFVPSRVSPEGKSNIVIKQEATVPLLVNTDQDISVQSRDYTGSDIHVNNHFEKSSDENHDLHADINAEMKTNVGRTRRDSHEDKIGTEEYNIVAMEAYRASKQSQRSCRASSKKQKVPAGYGNPHNGYLPGKLESFIPVGKRSKTRPILDTAVSLPQLGKTLQTEDTEFQRTKLYKVRRGRIGSRKQRLCPLIGLERVSDKKGDLPYVEDWIRKLQINGKDPVSDKHLEPIERADKTFSCMPQQSPQMAQATYQEMELPSDFKPVTGLQQFQPLPSLYLYSLKQKSDLKVKLTYFDMPKLDEPKTDPGNQQKQSLKEELTQARTKVNVIENKLEELYRSETNLDKIVSRQQIKPLKKQNGRFIDITTGIANCIPDTNSSRERQVDNHTADVITSMDPTHFPKVSDEAVEGQSKINTISLSLSANELHGSKDDDPSTTESNAVTQGEDFHLTSTSSWKHQSPITPRREKSGKVLEGRTLCVFGDRGVGRDDRLADQTDNSLMDHPDAAIASVKDCNASGSEVDPNQQNRHGTINGGDEELDEEKTGSMLSSVVLEVLEDLLDHLDVPEETDEQPSSSTDGGSSNATEEMAVNTVKDTSASGESLSEVAEGSSQGQGNIVRLCSFCDEPHEIT